MKFKKIFFILALLVSLVSYSHALQTSLFSINLPKGFVPLSKKSTDNIGENFTYSFIQANKERKKTILIVITGERINDSNNNLEDSLLTATQALRSTAMKSACKSTISTIKPEIIDHVKWLYFEKISQECSVSVEKYWSTINDKYFISFYLARPPKGDEKIFKQSENSIKQIKLK